MGDLVSLSKLRKARARTLKEQQAAENRVRFGRTKAEKQRDKAIDQLAAKQLEAARRDD